VSVNDVIAFSDFEPTGTYICACLREHTRVVVWQALNCVDTTYAVAALPNRQHSVATRRCLLLYAPSNVSETRRLRWQDALALVRWTSTSHRPLLLLLLQPSPPAQLLRACFPPTFRSLLLKMSVEQQCLRNMQSYCRVGYFRLFSLGFIFRILFPTNVRE